MLKKIKGKGREYSARGKKSGDFLTPPATVSENRRKIALAAISLIFLFASFTVRARADGQPVFAGRNDAQNDTVSTDSMPQGYSDALDSLPDEVKEALPEGVFSDDAGKVGEAVAEMSTARFLLDFLGQTTGAQLGRALLPCTPCRAYHHFRCFLDCALLVRLREPCLGS